MLGASIGMPGIVIRKSISIVYSERHPTKLAGYKMFGGGVVCHVAIGGGSHSTLFCAENQYRRDIIASNLVPKCFANISRLMF